MDSWPLAFALTLLLETPLDVLGRRRRLGIGFALAVAVALNLASHPLAWHAFAGAGGAPRVFVGVELLVWLGEALLIVAAARLRARSIPILDALRLAFAANALSAGAGLLLQRAPRRRSDHQDAVMAEAIGRRADPGQLAAGGAAELVSARKACSAALPDPAAGPGKEQAPMFDLMSRDQESGDEPAPRRAIVLAVQLPEVSDAEFASSLAELAQLAKTLGLQVVGQVTQKRQRFDQGAYVGTGKREQLRQQFGGEAPEPKRRRGGVEDEAPVDEVAESAANEDEDEAGEEALEAAGDGAPAPRPELLLVDHELSPSQARNLEKETGALVLDRTAVILEIFHRHARSRAAKAQVEIVRLQYLAPRLRESGKGRDRQRGGIGGKGAGESNLELDRRKIRDRIAELTEELASLEQERQTQRARRRELRRVALVGYTNAGKSTLMRGLTGSEVYVADKLFATLDTTVRALQPEVQPRVLVSDTVGFIKNLPHGLVASFKSTLDEALEASLLLHIVDAADADFARQLAVTEQVLAEIGAGEVPRLLVFNKIDRVGDDAAQAERARALAARWPDSLVVSARRAEDVVTLRERVLDFFRRELVEDELHVGYDRQAMRGAIYAECEVLGERYDESGVFFRVRATPAAWEKLRALLAAPR